MVQGRAHDGAQRGVHPTGVTAAGDHSDTCWRCQTLVHARLLVHGHTTFIDHNRVCHNEPMSASGP